MRIRFVFILLLSPLLLFAQADYAADALWIKNEGGYDLDTNKSSITRPTIEWTPYKGTQPITKSEFFTMAGMEEEAGDYAEMEAARDTLTWSAVALSAISMVTMLCMPQEKAGQITAIATGAAAVALGISAGIVDSRISILFSIPLALETARTYDKKMKGQRTNP
jgi:hypothetical protein